MGDMKKLITILAIETIALVVVVSFASWLSTYNVNLIRVNHALTIDLIREEAEVCEICRGEEELITMTDVSWRDIFDDCTQEKFLIGDELVAMTALYRECMGIEVIHIPSEEPTQ